MKPLKKCPHNVSFTLTGEKMPFRLVVDMDSRMFGGVTQVYIAPYSEGRIHKDRGRWIDWETKVTEIETA